MHTFIVRLFDAEDVDAFTGWIEEPMTGRRLTFHDADELVASLCSPWETSAPDLFERTSGDVGSSDPSPKGRS